MITLKTSLIRTVALTALLGGLAVAPLAHAQDTDTPAAAQDQTTPAAAPAKAGKGMMNVETRIKTLHDKLKITSAEESDWNAVAQTMRDNETAMMQLIQERHQNAEGMTAVDDLQSYQQITQSHADGLQKMVAAFKTLYGDMSDDQKKNADSVFASFEGHGGAKHHKHKNS